MTKGKLILVPTPIDENSKLNQELLNFKDYANIKTVVDSKQDDKVVEYNNRINKLVQDYEEALGIKFYE